MKTFITESELKNRVAKLKAYTDIISEEEDDEDKEDKEPLKGDQTELDADKDGDIEKDDLADLRASKKNESAPIGESVGFCNDNSLIRILAITNRVIK
jgi:hypothetical protein